MKYLLYLFINVSDIVKRNHTAKWQIKQQHKMRKEKTLKSPSSNIKMHPSAAHWQFTDE